jgi:hypothetical protein
MPAMNAGANFMDRMSRYNPASENSMEDEALVNDDKELTPDGLNSAGIPLLIAIHNTSPIPTTV